MRTKVLLSRLIAPEVLFAFPVTIVPATSPEPPAPPVPALAPPLFSFPAPALTLPPLPALPPSLPRATLAPERARARVRLVITLSSPSLSTVASIVRPLMSPGQSQPRSTSASVVLTSLSEPASAEALPVCTSPPSLALPPEPPFPADAPPLFSFPAPAVTEPPAPPAPPVLPSAMFAPVCELDCVTLTTEPRFITLIVIELEFIVLGVGGGNGPSHGPSRSEVVSHGSKSTFAETASPVPGPTPLGPLTLPHQLQVPSTRLPFSTSMPKAAFPVMEFLLIERSLWLGVPPPFTKSLTTTPSPLPLMMLSVMVRSSIEATAAAFRVSATAYVPGGVPPLTSLSPTVAPFKSAPVPARLWARGGRLPPARAPAPP